MGTENGLDAVGGEWPPCGVHRWGWIAKKRGQSPFLYEAVGYLSLRGAWRRGNLMFSFPAAGACWRKVRGDEACGCAGGRWLP
ncbi:hypothetical protein [Anaerospora sp.]|uniref:hypothetical protein n=1 Tax=Anaerospora sp. TaxID=1960278 RepID=UPI0028A1184E|nr:hypothetical protein [Anaerospora sp.]